MPCHLSISGWPVWELRRVCAAMCSCIWAAVSLRFLEGPSVGKVPFHCRRPAAVGMACVCRVGRGVAVLMVSRVFMWGCS